jgi:hypothetical protein
MLFPMTTDVIPFFTSDVQICFGGTSLNSSKDISEGLLKGTFFERPLSSTESNFTTGSKKGSAHKGGETRLASFNSYMTFKYGSRTENVVVIIDEAILLVIVLSDC